MVIPIRRSLALPVATFAIALVQPMAALAHAGGEPLIHVPADHLEPGQPFHLIAADLGPSARVTLELAATDQKLSLGTVTTGPDGHFESTLTLPASFPVGYAELTATSDDGSFASTWVRVGAGPEVATPPTADQDAQWFDASLILIPVGAVILFIIWRFRGRPAR
jgi:hypothetical protein